MTEVADYEYEEVVVEEEVEYEYEEVEILETDDPDNAEAVDYGYNNNNNDGDDANPDYGYGDNVDYGYGDSAEQDYGYNDTAAADHQDYGYGDSAPDSSAAYGYGDPPPTASSPVNYGYGDAVPATPSPPAAAVTTTTKGRKKGRRNSIGAAPTQTATPTSSSSPGKKGRAIRRSSLGGQANTAATEAAAAQITPLAAGRGQFRQSLAKKTTTTKSPKTPKTKKKKAGAGLASLMQSSGPDVDNPMGSPKERRRAKGRRLSMFAFAGQEDDQVGQFSGPPGSAEKSVSEQSQQSSSSKRSSASKRGGGGRKMSNLHNQHNYGSIMGKNDSNHGGPPSDDDMLSSFLKGGGMPGGGIVGSGGEPATKKGNRRLSMMAFAGGEEVVQEEEKLDPGLQQQLVAQKPTTLSKRSATTTGASRRAKPQSQQQMQQGRRGLQRSNSSDNLPASAILAGGGAYNSNSRGGVNAAPAFASPRRTGRRASIGGANPANTQEKSFVTTTATSKPTSTTPAQAAAAKKAMMMQQAQQHKSMSNVEARKSSSSLTKPAAIKTRAKSGPMNKAVMQAAASAQFKSSSSQQQQQLQQQRTATEMRQSLNKAAMQTTSSGQVRSSQSQQQQQQSHMGRGKFATTQQQLNKALSQSEHGGGVSRNPSGYSKGSGASKGRHVHIKAGGPTVLTSQSMHGGTSGASAASAKKPTGVLRSKNSKSQQQPSIAEQSASRQTGESSHAAGSDEELQQYMQNKEERQAGGTTATTGESTNLLSRPGKSPDPSSAASSASSASSSVSAKDTAAAAMATGVPSTNNMSLLYFLARCCDWEGVMDEVQVNHRDAKVVSEKDGTTALHLAVMSRTNPMMRDGMAGAPAPLNVIEELVKACPEACIIRCTKKRYTPLHYACVVADDKYDMEDCCQIVEVLLKHSPHAPFVFTDDGFSALDVHILSYSQLHKHKEEVYSGARSSTGVVRTLLAGEPSLADARVYRNKIRGPLELLYRCNIDEFKEAAEFEELAALEGDTSDAKRKELLEKFGSVASILSDWWAWKWSLLLLKFASISAGQEVVPFNAVQAAARLVGCPLPILALAVTIMPEQVTQRDPTGDIYNLPLHEVCGWRADMENVAGDPFIATRKFKAMRLLLEQYPEAARMTNNCGETPLQLAVETCTPWHGGLETLVEACPKALKFPRKLRITDNGLSLSVAHHSAIDSVGTVDSDEADPLEDIENMYPFLVSAVLGGVSKNKRRPPVSYTDDMATEHYQNLDRKSLQAIRAVFGLLRARPEVMEKYRKLVTSEMKKKKKK
mmetsp:Transcript_18651/g.43980  ORF Transcript_18651/g.43980 Transcript_18651/m.43980 type:complete len:1290 (+) Transcript_18651:560-4429(+)